MSREIHVDPDLCIGSGNCSYYAPKTFDLSDDLVAIVIDPEGDPDEQIRLAVEGCPTRAISLREP